MTTRRHLIAGFLATATLPSLTWADAGGPSYLACARERDGGFALFGLTSTGQETFRIPLPARAHAGAAHPHRPQAIVFARRPGVFALVVDCVAGRVTRELTAPKGWHFSGHGVFSADGETLFTGEIDNQTGMGAIGVWAQADGYRRSGAFASGGIGPHEILRLPGQDILAVANGGIIFALDDERTKLNIDTMQPNLSYLSMSGAMIEQVILEPDLHHNSIRHLAVGKDGTIAFAMQWQGDATVAPPLVGLHRIGQAAHLLEVPAFVAHRLAGYTGSIACSRDDGTIAVSCPRGDMLVLFGASGKFLGTVARPDVCGLAAASAQFVATDGFGGIARVTGTALAPLRAADQAWDNHLVAI